jgi:transposase
MPTVRLPMRKIRDVLRLCWVLGCSVRQTSQSLGLSTGVISKMTNRAELAGLDWQKVQQLSDQQLEQQIYGKPVAASEPRPEPDVEWMYRELRKKGVTVELLHLEYLRQHPTGYHYTAFCDRYRSWLGKRGLSMRQTHKAGDKCFVDYSGKRPCIVDRDTGERKPVELFVAVLGASNYTYAEATISQRSDDFIASNERALRFFGGVPRALVPDQLRSAISTPCWYEPKVQRTYQEFANHYGTSVFAARPGKPKDKAKVEVAVQIVQRWILARLRNETFFSLEALNERIAQLLQELNTRPMKRYGGTSRLELFEQTDRPELLPLPLEYFEYCTWKNARVNLDYHIDVERHYYSVPHVLLHEKLEARVTARTVEVFHVGRRVALHPRSYVLYKHTTDPTHLPADHRAWLRADPAEIQQWAKSVGPCTEAMVNRILSSNFYPEQCWRSARGLKRIGQKYGPERTEAACAKALRFGARSYKPVERMLKHGLEQRPLPEDEQEQSTHAVIEHDNVRGAQYFVN